MKKKKRALKLVLAVLALTILGCGAYLCDYYPAEPAALEVFAPVGVIGAETTEAGDRVFGPKDAAVGFIFYPGGKVDSLAYVPLMRALTEKGVLCVLVEMPFHLAVFDMDAAEGIQRQYPEVERWYIGGHSLGGSMAASYAATCPEDYEGLVLLGSYSTADLSASGLQVLSVYGSEDTVLNRENYEENKANLPKDFTEIVLEGGCHAYFGMYGAQDGDGVPTITQEEQITMTAEAFAAMAGLQLP